MKQFYLQIAACLVVALSYGITPKKSIFSTAVVNHHEASSLNDDESTMTTEKGHLKLTLESGEQRYHTDFYFNAQSTFGLDRGYDAGIMGSIPPAFSIYSKLIEPGAYAYVNLAIQSLPYQCLMEETIIPISINMNQGLKASIRISEKTLPSEVEVYLEDTYTNTLTLLINNVYSFTSEEALSGTGRFNIKIRNITTYKETLSDEENSLTLLKLFLSKNERSIIVKGDVDNNTNLTLTDLQGRPILEAELKSKKMNKISVVSVKPGIYIIRLQENSNTLSKKIIIQ